MPDPVSNIPLTLSAEAEERLERAIRATYDKNYAVLEPLRKRIKLWRDLYDGNVTPTWKPWKESSEIFFPVARMVADAARARIFQTFFQQRDVLTAESIMQASDYMALTGAVLADDLSAFRRASNELILDENEIDLRSRLDAILGETTQVGTAAVRTAHEFARAPKKKRLDPQGKPIIAEDVILQDKVTIRTIPPESCVWDTSIDEFSDCRFFAYPYELGYDELKRIAKEQDWNPATLSAILLAPDTIPTPEREDERRRSHLLPVPGASEEILDAQGVPHPVAMNSRYVLREVYLRNMDVDEDGVLEDAVVTWHRASRRVARPILWPYIHNEMPIDLIWHEQRRNRPIGQGVIEPGATLCAGVNAVANQTIDAQSIRNCPTLIVPEVSESQEDLEQGWHPGLILTERGPGEIHTLEFGQTGNTVVSMSIFSQLIDVYFRISHLGASQFGDVATAQRTPADLGQSIMQEGAQLLDKIISRTRSSMVSIIRKVLMIYWQTQPGKFAAVVGADDFVKIQRLINTLGWDGLSLNLNVSSAAHSRELDRQNFAGLPQFVFNYARMVLELVGQIGGSQVDPKTGIATPPNPMLQAAGAAWLRSSQAFMRQFVETFPNVTDSEAFIPDIASQIDQLLAAQQQQAAAGAQGAQGGAGVGSFLSPATGVPPAAPGPGYGSILQ